MDKSVAAKVSNHIYDDVALVILSKLSIKSLFRFSCVCKSWSLLLQIPCFMDMLGRNFLSADHSYYNDTSLLLHHTKPWRKNYYDPSVLCYLFGERFENMIKLDWPNLLGQTDFRIYGSESVNGILCIEGTRDQIIIDNRYVRDQGRVVLWNPATNECKVTPPSPYLYESPLWDPVIRFHGFGYDKVSDDYKVIRHIGLYPNAFNFCCEGNCDGDCGTTIPDNFWEIYCLKSNNWRKLDIEMPSQYSDGVDGQVYTDGVCHWWSQREGQYRPMSDEICLVSFNLNNETFVKTLTPSNMNYIDSSSYTVLRNLKMLNGSIGLISNYIETGIFHISILGEIGIKETWIKLFIVGPLPCVRFLIGIGKKGDMFFKKKNNELVWFNLNTQKIEELGVKGDSFTRIIIYKESFLPFERLNN